MVCWDNIRIAYIVARAGTVSRAAAELGYHRATVARHIDALERELGQKLFVRHDRGYSPTEVGRDLMNVASSADALFNNFVSRTAAHMNTESVLVVSGSNTVSSLLQPVIERFRDACPGVRCKHVIQHVLDPDLVGVQNGETHIAAVTGPRPGYQHFIVRDFTKVRIGLYASHHYARTYGLPSKISEFKNHWFVGYNDPVTTAGHIGWANRNIPASRWAITSDSYDCVQQHLHSGLGIAFCTEHDARKHNLVQVIPPPSDWAQTCWLVTHRDTNSSPNVTRFLSELNTLEGLGLDRGTSWNGTRTLHADSQ
ncbi:MAG: LysR family transcriptional regulator [Pseudomonadota bacterium]